MSGDTHGSTVKVSTARDRSSELTELDLADMYFGCGFSPVRMSHAASSGSIRYLRKNLFACFSSRSSALLLIATTESPERMGSSSTLAFWSGIGCHRSSGEIVSPG